MSDLHRLDIDTSTRPAWPGTAARISPQPSRNSARQPTAGWRLRQLARALLSLMLLAPLAGCVESDQPLSDPATAQPDERLFGTWTREQDRTYEIVIVGVDSPDSPGNQGVAPQPCMMRFWSHSMNQVSHEVSPASGAQFFATHLGDASYGNWVIPPDPSRGKSAITYLFIKYRVDGDQVTIWLQDPEATARAIEAGQLAGRVRRGIPPNQGFDELRITASSQQLAAFFATAAGQQCFPDRAKVTYRRLRAPAAR